MRDKFSRLEKLGLWFPGPKSTRHSSSTVYCLHWLRFVFFFKPIKHHLLLQISTQILCVQPLGMARRKQDTEM